MTVLEDNDKSRNISETIIPIDFSPNDGKGPRQTFKFKLVHAALLFFGSIFGFSGWFVLTAKSVFVQVTPITAQVEISGGLNIRLGQRYLIRNGEYSLKLTNDGYHVMNTDLYITENQSQTHSFEMDRLPGVVSVTTQGLAGARVQIDGVDVGITPLNDIPVEFGAHYLQISYDRYLDLEMDINVEGRGVKQEFSTQLEPAWAVVGLTTIPDGAEVLLDGVVIGETPLDAEIIQGRRDIMLKLAGFKAWSDQLSIVAGEDFVVPSIELDAAEGLVFVLSDPPEASLTVGGVVKGLTPLEVALAPGQDHELTLFKNGYQSKKSMVRTVPNEEKAISIALQAITADVEVIAYPEDAELFVDGDYRGSANQIIQLMAASQQIEIRREGYVPYVTDFTSRPGIDQVIRVSLKSLEQERLEQIKPIITSVAGESLKLFYHSKDPLIR